MSKIKEYSLYLVISEEYSSGKKAYEIANLAIAGGVDIIQIREKYKPREKIVKLAASLLEICKKNKVILIVNDDPEIAKECGARGVHLGQEDMLKYSVKSARDILGKDRIIGVSTHSLGQLDKANREDVDYIAYGPIFPTKTKDYFLGLKDIKEVLRMAKKPVFFIGGINLSNLDEILNEGAKNIAVIRGIIDSEDISLRVKSFKDILKMRI